MILTIGIYAANTNDPHSLEMRETIKRLTAAHPEILQMHGFYAAQEEKIVSFDLIFDFKAENAAAIQSEIAAALAAQYPDYRFYINIDRDFSE